MVDLQAVELQAQEPEAPPPNDETAALPVLDLSMLPEQQTAGAAPPTDDATPTGQNDAITPTWPDGLTPPIEQLARPEPSTDDHEIVVGDNDPTGISTVIDVPLALDELGPLDPSDGAPPPLSAETVSEVPESLTLGPSSDASDEPSDISDVAVPDPDERSPRRRLFGRRRRRGEEPPTPTIVPEPVMGSDTTFAATETSDPQDEREAQDQASSDTLEPFPGGSSDLPGAPRSQRRPRRNVVLPGQQESTEATTDDGALQSIEAAVPGMPKEEPPSPPFPIIDTNDVLPKGSLFTGPTVEPLVVEPPEATSIGWTDEAPLVSPSGSRTDDQILEFSGVEPERPASGELFGHTHDAAAASLFSDAPETAAVDIPSIEAASELFVAPVPDTDWHPLDEITAARLSDAINPDAEVGAATSELELELELEPEPEPEPESTEEPEPEPELLFPSEYPPVTATHTEVDAIPPEDQDEDWLTVNQAGFSEAITPDTDIGTVASEPEPEPTHEPEPEPEPTHEPEPEPEPEPELLFPSEYPPVTATHTEVDAIPPENQEEDWLSIDAAAFMVGGVANHEKPAEDALELFDDYVPSWADGSEPIVHPAANGPAVSVVTEFFSLDGILADLRMLRDKQPERTDADDHGLPETAALQFDILDDTSQAADQSEVPPAVSTGVATPVVDLAELPEESGDRPEAMIAIPAMMPAGLNSVAVDPHGGASSTRQPNHDVFAELADLDGTEGIRGILDDAPDTDGHIDSHDWWDFEDTTQRNDDRAGFRAAANATEAIDLTGTEQISLAASDLAAPPTASKPSDLDALDGPDSVAYEAAMHAFFDAHDDDDGKDGLNDPDDDEADGLFTSVVDDSEAISERYNEAEPGSAQLDSIDDRDGVDRWVEDTEDSHGDWLERTRRTTAANVIGAIAALLAIIGLLMATVWVVQNI
ncbi:MAG: hypothetical protein WAT56_08255 [Candidatus Microthrix parvicella]